LYFVVSVWPSILTEKVEFWKKASWRLNIKSCSKICLHNYIDCLNTGANVINWHDYAHVYVILWDSIES
jgi:hypothetical protein